MHGAGHVLRGAHPLSPFPVGQRRSRLWPATGKLSFQSAPWHRNYSGTAGKFQRRTESRYRAKSVSGEHRTPWRPVCLRRTPRGRPGGAQHKARPVPVASAGTRGVWPPPLLPLLSHELGGRQRPVCTGQARRGRVPGSLAKCFTAVTCLCPLTDPHRGPERMTLARVTR